MLPIDTQLKINIIMQTGQVAVEIQSYCRVTLRIQKSIAWIQQQLYQLSKFAHLLYCLGLIIITARFRESVGSRKASQLTPIP